MQNGVIDTNLEYQEGAQLEQNLRIIAPQPVEVTFVEADETERIARIKTRVPMSVFHQMLASRQATLKKVRRCKLEILRSPENDGTDEVGEMLLQEAKEVEQEIMTGWLVEQVLAVWQRTEKDMTLERLENGLEFSQIEALFSRFFGGLMKSKQARDQLKQANYERG